MRAQKHLQPDVAVKTVTPQALASFFQRWSWRNYPCATMCFESSEAPWSSLQLLLFLGKFLTLVYLQALQMMMMMLKWFRLPALLANCQAPAMMTGDCLILKNTRTCFILVLKFKLKICKQSLHQLSHDSWKPTNLWSNWSSSSRRSSEEEAQDD